MFTTLSKSEARATLELMCRGKPVTRIPMMVPVPDAPARVLMPLPEEFGESYLASFQGAQVMQAIMDDDGQLIAETPIARKRGQEWRDEIELQESGEIVGYWAATAL